MYNYGVLTIFTRITLLINLFVFPGAGAGLVHAPCAVLANGWDFTVRSHVHRAVLHPVRHLGEPVLLPVRLPVPGVCYPGDLVRTDQCGDGVLPAVRRRLSLVVAQPHHIRRLCSVHRSLLCVLPHHKTRDDRVRAAALVLLIHVDHGGVLLGFDWHYWVLRGLLVLEEHLRRC